jgi:sulfatase modifying factor 1
MKKILLLSLLLSFVFQGLLAQEEYTLREKKAKYIQPKFCKVKDNTYMGTYEVSQGQYLEFLNDLQKKADLETYNKCYPDSVLIQSQEQDYFSSISYYDFFHHPAMANYPVSGITYDAANAYCQWLSEKHNDNPKRAFKHVNFRLPTSEEWEYAARGGRSKQPYPWGGPYLRKKDGSFLANFRRIGDESITVDAVTNQLVVIRADEDFGGVAGGLNDAYQMKCVINAYQPNLYGLYNMSGNVAEMLSMSDQVAGGSYFDTGYDIQVSSRKTMKQPSNKIGFRVLMQVMEP